MSVGTDAIAALKSVSRSVGVSPTSFQYDANGNRRLKNVNGVTTQTYTYNFENRLASLTDTANGTSLSFSGGLSV